MIAPTVGRSVHVYYRPRGFNAPLHSPEAAVITGVHHERLVDVIVFPAGEFPVPLTKIPLAQDCDVIGGVHAAWMPYQKGQAEKTEGLEKALAMQAHQQAKLAATMERGFGAGAVGWATGTHEGHIGLNRIFRQDECAEQTSAHHPQPQVAGAPR